MHMKYQNGVQHIVDNNRYISFSQSLVKEKKKSRKKGKKGGGEGKGSKGKGKGKINLGRIFIFIFHSSEYQMSQQYSIYCPNPNNTVYITVYSS